MGEARKSAMQNIIVTKNLIKLPKKKENIEFQKINPSKKLPRQAEEILVMAIKVQAIAVQKIKRIQE